MVRHLHPTMRLNLYCDSAPFNHKNSRCKMLLHLIKWKAGNSVAKQFSRFHSRLPVTLRKGGFLYDGMLVNISFSSEAHSPAPLYRSFVQILQIIQRTAADGKFRQPLPIQCRCNAQIHTSRQCKDHAFFERFFIAAGSDASLWHVQISGQDLTQNDSSSSYGSSAWIAASFI